MQRLVATQPHLLTDAIRAGGALQPGEQVQWVSPREDDEWAEYRDGAFLDRIGHPELRPVLAAFWPRLGPQWDALGRGSEGTIVLVEAKAHLDELASSCGASPRSRLQIEWSLAEAKTALGGRQDADWQSGYYQYANRLAHLHFLRAHQVPAALVFLYFTNDDEMRGPQSRDDWEAGLSSVYKHLGLAADSDMPGIVSVYLDTRVVV